jgi:hypothetical protein
MFSQQLIHALAADREREVANLLRSRLVGRREQVRWVRRPVKPAPRG